MLLNAFTFVHVLISLIGIVAGVVVVFGMFASKRLPMWASVFLWMTVLTSATGFLFPFHGFKPSYVVGAISLVVLAIAIYARNSKGFSGGWRPTYVITSVVALYLNVFVLIVQSFEKVPALHALAPTQTEPPFKIAQLVTLVVFVILGIVATIKFHPAPAATPLAE
jgi:hypothetical protein